MTFADSMVQLLCAFSVKYKVWIWLLPVAGCKCVHLLVWRLMVLEGTEGTDVNQSGLQMLQRAAGPEYRWSSKPAFYLRWLKSFSWAFCCSRWITWKSPVILTGQKNLVVSLLSFLSRYQPEILGVRTCVTGSLVWGADPHLFHLGL